MLFKNDDPTYALSIRGTCFLVQSHGRIFAATAQHNVRDFTPQQYRIPAALGSMNMLHFTRPFTVKLHSEIFEDFVLIPIDDESLKYNDYNPACSAAITTSGVKWTSLTQLYVTGFPTELNNPDYEEGVIAYQPVWLPATLLSKPNDEGIGSLQVSATSNLNSFDGFSGSPIFSENRLIGIVLHGSQDTSISQKLHFLDSRVLDKVIEYHLSQESSST